MRVLLVSFAALAAGAPLGCSNCGEGKTPSAAQRQAAPGMSEGEPVLPPTAPSGHPVSGDVFKTHVPDTVAGFTAVAPGEASSSPLANGGTLTRFGRNYKRGEQTLRVELSDSLHAPLLSKIIRQQQGTERKGDTSDLIGMAVGGQPAVLMYQSGAQTAYANVLLGDRVLLNVQVVPADGIESAVEVASALPLAALATLIPTGDPAAPSNAATPSANPAAATAPAAPAAPAKPEPGKTGAASPAPAAPAPKAPRSPD